MAKWQILIIMLLMVHLAIAAEICDDYVEPLKPCIVTTPVVDCSTYDLINLSDGSLVIDDGTMAETTANTGVYNFTFNQSEGEYKVILCDNSTLAINVKYEVSKMIIAAIILIPLLLAFLLMFISYALGETHTVIKIFLMLLSLIMFITSFHYGTIAVIEFYDMPELQNAMANTTYWFTLVFVVIITYFIIHLIIIGFRVMADRKKQKLEY